MGRPPIMTLAERVRRHRLKHCPEPVTKLVTKLGTVDVEALVARIRELEVAQQTFCFFFAPRPRNGFGSPAGAEYFHKPAFK